jgi:anion-transporting  ArsA/GET3 family ATPase
LDPRAFCEQARLVIVAGKGGVGKTVVSAALARLAADHQLSTLICEVEGKSGLTRHFGLEEVLGYDELVLAEADGSSAVVKARSLAADRALREYLESHGLRRVIRRLSSGGALEVVATATPGLKDILILGKIKQLEQAAASDFFVLDGPAAGHAVTFLTSAAGILDSVSSGPLRDQAQDVSEMLSDPSRCQVMLVTLPEETPVNELVETAFALEDRVGVHLTPVIVNSVFPERTLDVDPVQAAAQAGFSLTSAEADALRSAAVFRQERQEVQAEQIRRLADALPLPQIHLPFIFNTEIGTEALDVLAAALGDGIRRLPGPGSGERS